MGHHSVRAPVFLPGGPENGLMGHACEFKACCNPCFTGGSQQRSLQGCSLLLGEEMLRQKLGYSLVSGEEPTICSWGNRQHQLSQAKQPGCGGEVPGFPTIADSRPPYSIPLINAGTAGKQLHRVPPRAQPAPSWGKPRAPNHPDTVSPRTPRSILQDRVL